MRITKDQRIAGVSAFELRDLFRRLNGSFDVAWLTARLELPTEQGLATLEALIAGGYVEPADVWDGVQNYCPTMKGGALKLASATKPISRATAEKLAREVVERAKAINASDDYVYRVSKLTAFGSYLSSTPTLGDVDLAVDLVPRLKDRVKHEKAMEAFWRDAASNGKRFKDFFDRLSWPTISIYQELRNRSSALSLHHGDDRVLEGAQTKVLYEFQD